jgi:nitrite reductase/ring-hydroxylating ferredoxin subunit/hemoglobin-like flavoprotein
MNQTETSPQINVVAKRGAPDAGRYFRYMAQFVSFTQADERAIQQTKPIIEKHLPQIVADFYDHLLRYPPTRKFFIKPDGTLDEVYLKLRMQHNANFWLRTVEGNYDDDYASYVDYVGRAHTSHGADPHIYIAERYVIGMVGFMSHALSQAIVAEMHDKDQDLLDDAVEAWDKLMMVVLEMLSRAYYNEREQETFDPLVEVDATYVSRLAADVVAEEIAPKVPQTTKRVTVARAADLPEGERKIVEVDGISIGIFHHNGNWVALRNRCLHRGGPVCTGKLEGDVLTCPWHGFQYNVNNGQLLIDPKSHLDAFAVHVEDGDVILEIPQA